MNTGSVGPRGRRLLTETTMSSVQCLKQFVSERLSCAAEEIFRVFEQTVFEYEREIRRQRGLLDHRRAEPHPPRGTEPHLHLHHDQVLKEPLRPQQRNVREEPGDQAPPHVKKEEQEQGDELHTFQEEQQGEEFHTFQEEELGLNETTSTSALTLPCQEIHECKQEGPVHRPLPVAESHAPRGVSAEGAEPQRRRHGDDTFQTLFSHSARKSFTCAICGKGFRFRCRLNLHMRTHTGEKLYSCDTCGKRFTQKTNVERHQRIHTGENPYVCKVCGKGFKQVGERNVHLRVHTDERLYCCGTCGKRLKTKQTMLVHMRTHTGERPFICNTCGRSFIQATTLTQHMRNHAH